MRLRNSPWRLILGTIAHLSSVRTLKHGRYLILHGIIRDPEALGEGIVSARFSMSGRLGDAELIARLGPGGCRNTIGVLPRIRHDEVRANGAVTANYFGELYKIDLGALRYGSTVDATVLPVLPKIDKNYRTHPDCLEMSDRAEPSKRRRRIGRRQDFGAPSSAPSALAGPGRSGVGSPGALMTPNTTGP
jgi:hypothetical protein